MLRTALVLLLVTGVAAAEDSPMVALAKRTNRKAPKARVITNETLAATQGRISVASGDGQQSATTPAAAKPQSAAAPAPAPAPAPAVQPAPVSKPAAPAAPAPATPADVNARYSTTVRTIEPTSSARTITPQSSAGTIQPTTGRNLDPQSTARTTRPESTVQYVTPPANNQPPQ